MLISRRASGAVAALSVILVAGSALAVYVNKGDLGQDAQAVGQVQVAFTFIDAPAEKEDDRVTAGPILSGDTPSYQIGLAQTMPSNYFRIGRNSIPLITATTRGINVAGPDPTASGFPGGFIQSNMSYWRGREQVDLQNAVYDYKWNAQVGISLGANMDFFKYHFGTGSGWTNFPNPPQVSVGNLVDLPTAQQFGTVLQATQKREGLASAAVSFPIDLTETAKAYNLDRLKNADLYQTALGQRISQGDRFNMALRYNTGSYLHVIGNYLSPANSEVVLGQDFSFVPSGRASGLTDDQLRKITRLQYDNKNIPNGTFVGSVNTWNIGQRMVVEARQESDRDYYYRCITGDIRPEDVYELMDDVSGWEGNFRTGFTGFEPSVWQEGAAQAGPTQTRRADPKPNLARLPNDSYFHGRGSWGQEYDDQWGLKQIGIKASGRDGGGALWPRQAATTIVAVVDSGIDYAHPELKGVLAANYKEIPNNGKDDDGNGFVDDFLGWNFVDTNNDASDLNGHGTFVAGIIAANTDNAYGIAGINPWARILPVKVTNFDNVGSSVDVASGIVYAARRGARVINVSIAGPINKITQSAINEAVKLGAVVVVAAGNDGKNTQDVAPAGLKGVITVAATGPNGKRESFSNWGSHVSIAAPGTDILSLRAIQTDLLQFADKQYKPGTNIVGSDRRHYRLTGTSFSAPYVAGVASLLFSLNPKLTADQVKRMILQSATDIDVPGTDQFTGYGLLNAVAAVKADPAFYVDALLKTAQVVKKDGGVFVQVRGTADADRFAKAWVEIGAGEQPKQWRKVGRDITKRVPDGVLQDIAAGDFAGSSVWTLRVIAQHQNGRTRENRFLLKTN